MLKSLLCVAAMAVTTTAAPLPAQAETVSIKTNDLDLTSAAGLETLDQRIMSTARRLCRDGETTGTRLRSRESVDCVKRAVAQARERLAAASVKTSS